MEIEMEVKMEIDVEMEKEDEWEDVKDTEKENQMGRPGEEKRRAEKLRTEHIREDQRRQ